MSSPVKSRLVQSSATLLQTRRQFTYLIRRNSDKKWEFNGGLRWDRFDADGITTTGAPVSRVDRMLSVRAGPVFKPLPQGSIYASYGTSLNPSLEGLVLTTRPTQSSIRKRLTPSKAGSKWDFFSGRMLLSGAVFRVEKLNARTPGFLPGDPPQVLEGKQRVEGLELSVEGNITRGWQVLAGYTFLDSMTLDSNVPGGDRKKNWLILRRIRSTFGPRTACLRVFISAAAHVSSIAVLATPSTLVSSMPIGLLI